MFSENSKGVVGMKSCVLDEKKPCTGCGCCDICDLDPNKKCDNCGQCIALENDYVSIAIDEIIQNP